MACPLLLPFLKLFLFFGYFSYFLTILGNEKSARSFSDRSFFVDVRAACPCQNACFSRIWRAWPKFLAGCPQRRPAENFGVWADFSFLIFFPIFRGRASEGRNQYFSYFGPEARNLLCSRPTGSQNLLRTNCSDQLFYSGWIFIGWISSFELRPFLPGFRNLGKENGSQNILPPPPRNGEQWWSLPTISQWDIAHLF